MVNRTRKLPVSVLMLLSLLATACWSPSLVDGAYPVVVTSNVVYGQGVVNGGAGSADLRLDLYSPQGTGQAELPLVVVVHGGGFFTGSKSAPNVVEWATEFAERGYLVASIEYRLQGSNPVPSSRVQPLLDAVNLLGGDPQAVAAVAAIDDTLTALDYLIALPQSADHQTTLVGGSAGSVAIDYVAYGLDDFGIDRPVIRNVISNWGGFPVGSADQYIQNPMPTESAPYFEPPIFLAHATGDTSASPYSLSVDIADRAAAVGLDHRFYTKVADAHVFDLTEEQWVPGMNVLEAQIAFVTCNLHPHLADTPECQAVG
jgi:acetyl esterase/lipase